MDWEQRQISATKHLTGIEQPRIPLSLEYQFSGIEAGLFTDEANPYSRRWFTLFAQHGKTPGLLAPKPTNLRAQTLTRSSKRISISLDHEEAPDDSCW